MTNIVQNLTMWCAYDSNPGLQDGRRGRIHRAMAATPFEITICRCHFNPLFFPIFLNWPSFSFIFVFSNKHDNSYNKYMCKMLCPSSMQRRDSNPRLLEPESPPITTRPGLPPPLCPICSHRRRGTEKPLNRPATHVFISSFSNGG